MRDFILLISGGLLMYLWLKKNNGEIMSKGMDNPLENNYVKPGDKSKDIENMQKVFEEIAGVKFDQYGAYDVDTQEVAKYLLSGTNVISGSDIKTSFVNTLSVIHNNSQVKEEQI